MPSTFPPSPSPSTPRASAAALRAALASDPSIITIGSSTNHRLSLMLATGERKVVDALLSLGSSPYEKLVVEPSGPAGTTTTKSLLGWALSTPLDHKGTDALNRLLEAILDRVTNRRTAIEAVTRWAQGEWDMLPLITTGRACLLQWSLDAQAATLTRALPLADDALCQQVGLGPAVHDGVVDPVALRAVLRTHVLRDLLLASEAADSTPADVLATVNACLEPQDWNAPISDPVPDPRLLWPDMPWPWMAAVYHRWAILGAWLQTQPTDVWLAPVPQALATPPALPFGNGHPLVDRTCTPVRAPFHLLDLAQASLLGDTSAQADQRNEHALIAVLIASLERLPTDARVRAAWSPERLDAMQHWLIGHEGAVARHAPVSQVRTMIERPLLRQAVEEGPLLPSVPRPRL